MSGQNHIQTTVFERQELICRHRLTAGLLACLLWRGTRRKHASQKITRPAPPLHRPAWKLQKSTSVIYRQLGGWTDGWMNGGLRLLGATANCSHYLTTKAPHSTPGTCCAHPTLYICGCCNQRLTGPGDNFASYHGLVSPPIVSNRMWSSVHTLPYDITLAGGRSERQLINTRRQVGRTICISSILQTPR